MSNSERRTPLHSSSSPSSPRRVPMSPAVTQQQLPKLQINTAAIAAYNSWYQTMNSEWAWLIYTAIAIFVLVACVYIYNKVIYPDNRSSSATSSPDVLILHKIAPT